MKPKIKKLWVEALRSGEYEQGDSYLRSSDDKYCCLGVLCDLHQKATKKGNWGKEMGVFRYAETGLGSKTTPIPCVIKWAGIKVQNPMMEVKDKRLPLGLMGLNDSGSTFLKIADLIEEQL